MGIVTLCTSDSPLTEAVNAFEGIVRCTEVHCMDFEVWALNDRESFTLVPFSCLVKASESVYALADFASSSGLTIDKKGIGEVLTIIQASRDDKRFVV